MRFWLPKKSAPAGHGATLHTPIGSQVDDLVGGQATKGSVQQPVNPLIESARATFQNFIQSALTLRGSQKAPVFDDMNVRTLANPDRSLMRPARHPQCLESRIHAHQVTSAVYLSYAGCARWTDRTRCAFHL